MWLRSRRSLSIRPPPRTTCLFDRSAAVLALVLAAALAGFSATAVLGETIGGALAKAYLSNPDIGQQRAAVRAADEEVSKASSGYRPKVNAEADSQILEFKNKQVQQKQKADVDPGADVVDFAPPAVSTRLPKPRGFGLTVKQTLWDADRTLNSVRRADSQVMAKREQLRNTEQNVLMDGAAAYMNVLRDTALLALTRAHVHLLEEQLRETKDRFAAGEVTQTDIAQVEASLAGGEAAAFAAQSTLMTSIADYRRVIGEEPQRLDPAQPLTALLPATLDEAIATSQGEHPAIAAALFGVDAAALDVSVVESRLYPTVLLDGLVDRRFNVATEVTPSQPFTAMLTTRIGLQAL